MTIRKKIRNIFQRPTQEKDDVHAARDHDGVTVGDMHGNVLKLWDILLDQNIFNNGPNSPLTDNDYKELVRIHNDYKHYTSFYSSFQNKKKQLNETLSEIRKKNSAIMVGLPSTKEQEYKNQLRTLNDFGYTFEVANEEPKNDDIKNNTIYLYFTPSNKLNYAVRTLDGHIIREPFKEVDKKAHHPTIEQISNSIQNSDKFESKPFQSFLAQNAIIAELEKKDIFVKQSELKQKVENRKLRFQKILSKATLDPNLPDEFILSLIGDLLADRGPSDLLTLLTLLKLIQLFKEKADKSPETDKEKKLQCLLEIMISNHDSSFFQWYYKARYENQTSMTEVGIHSSQCVSLQGLGMELDFGLVSMKELDALMNEVYFPHLELFSYSEDVQENGDVHLTIRTHSPSPDAEIIDTIKQMVEQVDSTNPNKAELYKYETQEDIKKSIDTVNKAFQANLKTQEGLKKYIDDYKWQMVIGGIQSIANRMAELKTSTDALLNENDILALVSMVREVANIIYSKKTHYAEIRKQWEALPVYESEKAFFHQFLQHAGIGRAAIQRNGINDSDFEIIEAQLVSKNTSGELKNMPSWDLLTTPCPYFKITNNRWISKNREKQDQLAKAKKINIHRLYGHVGPSDDLEDKQNLDNHHGHGEIPQGYAYTITLISAKPHEREIEDNMLYVYKKIADDGGTLLYYATRTPEGDIVSNQALALTTISDEQFIELAKKVPNDPTAISGEIAEDERNAILLEAECRSHAVNKIYSRIAHTCSPAQHAKKLAAAKKAANSASAAVVPAETGDNVREDNGISEEMETPLSPNNLSSNQAYLKKCNHLLKLIDNAIYTFLRKEKERKQSTKSWFGWDKQEQKASALDPLITDLWAQEMKVREQIKTTTEEIRTEKLKQEEPKRKEIPETKTTRLNLQKIADHCSTALKPRLELKEHWSGMGVVRQGFLRFIRSLINPLSITKNDTKKDIRERQSLESLASKSVLRAPLRTMSMFAEKLRQVSRTHTDNQRVKARLEFVKFTRKP